MAAAIQTAFALEAVLVQGRNGVFDISVDGTKVIGKTSGEFPTAGEVVEAVRTAVDGS